MIRTFEKKAPKIHPTAFIHDAAEIIGGVTIGKNASVWPSAVLRGDVDNITLGEASNIQDNVVVHCREGLPAVIGKGVTVGHGAVVHGAKVGDLCLIGMGAIVMEAVIGAECIVGAGAMIPKGMKIPPRSLVLGMPAKAVRKLKPDELKMLRGSRDSYVELARRHRTTSRVRF